MLLTLTFWGKLTSTNGLFGTQSQTGKHFYIKQLSTTYTQNHFSQHTQIHTQNYFSQHTHTHNYVYTQKHG